MYSKSPVFLHPGVYIEISLNCFARLLSHPWLILDLYYVLIHLSFEKLLSQLAVETVIVKKSIIVTTTES